MTTPEGERLREEALRRIADRPNLVLNGDPIEELALAHERHAERLRRIVAEVERVGATNHLGDTVEGRAATHNIRVAVSLHEGSVVSTIKRQITDAIAIANQLRATKRSIVSQEQENTEGLRLPQ